MPELKPDMDALMRAGRTAFRPQAADRDRVRQSLARTLGESTLLEGSHPPRTTKSVAPRLPVQQWVLGGVGALTLGAAVVVAAHPWKTTRQGSPSCGPFGPCGRASVFSSRRPTLVERGRRHPRASPCGGPDDRSRTRRAARHRARILGFPFRGGSSPVESRAAAELGPCRRSVVDAWGARATFSARRPRGGTHGGARPVALRARTRCGGAGRPHEVRPRLSSVRASGPCTSVLRHRRALIRRNWAL